MAETHSQTRCDDHKQIENYDNDQSYASSNQANPSHWSSANAFGAFLCLGQRHDPENYCRNGKNRPKAQPTNGYAEQTQNH